MLLSPLRIESAFLPIMKPIPSPEQRLEVSGNCRSHHKKAKASTIYTVSSLAIHVWGPKVMTLWLRCCKAKLIDQRLPGDWADVCARLGDPGSRNNSRMKLWEDVAELPILQTGNWDRGDDKTMEETDFWKLSSHQRNCESQWVTCAFGEKNKAGSLSLKYKWSSERLESADQSSCRNSTPNTRSLNTGVKVTSGTSASLSGS